MSENDGLTASYPPPQETDLTNFKQIYWPELPANKYLKTLEPAMLTHGGIFYVQEIKPVGETEKCWVKVLYDRHYVIAKLKKYILQPLGCKSIRDLLIRLDEFQSGDNLVTIEAKIYKLHGEQMVRVAELKPFGINVVPLKEK